MMMIRPQDQLDERELGCLAAVADVIIPASPAYGAPGAGDPAILRLMLESLDRDRAVLRHALGLILEAAAGRLEDSPRDELAALLTRLRPRDPAGFAVIEAVVAKAYYRDPRVLTALAVEPVPPFPKGFAVENGDWSLLEAVRVRPPLWREVS